MHLHSGTHCTVEPLLRMRLKDEVPLPQLQLYVEYDSQSPQTNQYKNYEDFNPASIDDA